MMTMNQEEPSREDRLAKYDASTYGATDDGDPTGGGPYTSGSAIEGSGFDED
jgi:hypothetical protein